MVDYRIKKNNQVDDFCSSRNITKIEFDEILSMVSAIFDNNFIYMNVFVEESKIVVDVSVEMSDYEAFMVREKCFNMLEKNFKHVDYLDLRFSVYGD